MMAEAPKSTKKDKAEDKAADPKAKGPDPKATESKPAVEEAEVIAETPPKASGSSGRASAKAASTTTAAKSEATAEPDRAAATSSAEPAKPKTTAKTAPPQGSTPKPAAEDKPTPGPDKPATADGPAAKDAPVRRRGGAGSFLGLLLGGVAAAVIGFVAARTVVPEGWPFPGVAPEEDPLVGLVEAQGAEIAALGDRLGALDATLEQVRSDTSALDALRADVAARLDGLETGASDLAEQMGAMETRLSAVEKLAPEGSAAAEAAAEAYARELATLREMFAGELAEIDAAQAEASALEAQIAESAKAAAGRAALARVQAALDTGEPFAEALGELTEATGVEAPEALGAVAANGAPALGELQSAFPAAAREALDAATRVAVEDGSMGRMEAFLRTQLGTRSIEPREGDDADAVLSRAEAALKSGDLATVLAELDALPEAAKPALAEWRGLVETRAAALAAGTTLADDLNAK